MTVHGRDDGEIRRPGGAGVGQAASATPPPAVNEPLSFITFVAAYPVGTTVEGRSSRSPRTGRWSTSPCPTGGACTVTSR